MPLSSFVRCAFACHLMLLLCPTAGVWAQADAAPNRAQLPDSFKYYGPDGMWKLWGREDWQPHRIGRDSWIHWTWGNQKFLRFGAKQLSNSPLPISLDFFRVLDSRKRNQRFADLGLINEPNCHLATEPDQYGLWLDVFKGDPEHYYPGDPAYDNQQKYPGTDEVVTTNQYGRPSGILGLRLFDNPKFDQTKWDVKKYFKSPGSVEPPYLVGFSCALCHIAFDPTNPPADPNKPRWENLAANIGNQYFREGELFFTKGRVIFGDHNPGPNYENDPYDTRGVGPEQFVYHYAATQQPGTSETSRISYDFINNPNTINAIFNLSHRPTFQEKNPFGKQLQTMHILKDGADSVAVEWALMRVPVNIGCEGVYWFDSLFNPGTGEKQRPFRLAEFLNRLPDKEKQALHEKYGIDFAAVTPQRVTELKQKHIDDFGAEFGQDWAEAWKRVPSIAAYLSAYKPLYLKNAPGGAAFITTDAARLANGRRAFADHCAACHSNKQPPATATAEERKAFFRRSVDAADFLEGNTLSDDVRYSVRLLETNMARSLATNAVEGDVFAHFSSEDYKLLPSITRDSPIIVHTPVFPGQPPISQEFNAAGGGRGYYRTPSLVSLWATAPYLHNNGLGKYTGKISVEGRMEEFQDGIEKLLWPEKREITVKRVSQDCRLIPSLLPAIPALAAGKLGNVTERLLAEQLPPAIVEPVVRLVRTKVAEMVGRKLQSLENLDQVHDELKATLGSLLTSPEVTALLGQNAEIVTRLKTKLITELGGSMDLLKTLHRLDPGRIPAGTPVNLFANLNISRLPYAVLAQLNKRAGSREWAAALLSLSDCPDLVEDRGHLFGVKELSTQEKKDLIEFLKTF